MMNSNIITTITNVSSREINVVFAVTGKTFRGSCQCAEV